MLARLGCDSRPSRAKPLGSSGRGELIHQIRKGPGRMAAKRLSVPPSASAQSKQTMPFHYPGDSPSPRKILAPSSDSSPEPDADQNVVTNFSLTQWKIRYGNVHMRPERI